MEKQFIGLDANGTDGTDPRAVSAHFRVRLAGETGWREVPVALAFADGGAGEDAAILAALGIVGQAAQQQVAQAARRNAAREALLAMGGAEAVRAQGVPDLAETVARIIEALGLDN